jgi:sortase (surface protein transpeptidase)
VSKINPLIKIGSKLGVVFIVAGLIFALVAVLIMVHQHKTEPKPPPGALTSKSAPSSVKPPIKAVAAYNVPPTDPKYIAISSIGLSNTPVLRLGLTTGGAIAVPDNIYEAGWYDGSSRPGQAGAMFIYGHFSSWTADGIFYNLHKLQLGDSVTIIRGDNTTYTYKVLKIVVYPYNAVPMNTVLASLSSNTPGLNLMTCTGQVIKGTSEFNERLVVYTSLAS